MDPEVIPAETETPAEETEATPEVETEATEETEATPAEGEPEGEPTGEDAPPQGFHNDPKVQDYVKRQVEQALEADRAKREAEKTATPEAAGEPQFLSDARTTLTKALNEGTSEEIAQAFENLADAKLKANAEAQASQQAQQQAEIRKIDAEIASVKSKLADEGVKDVDDLDKFLADVEKSDGVEPAYRRAIKLRNAIGSAKADGEKVALRKKDSVTPGKPAGSSTGTLFQKGDDFDSIAEKGLKR